MIRKSSDEQQTQELGLFSSCGATIFTNCGRDGTRGTAHGMAPGRATLEMANAPLTGADSCGPHLIKKRLGKIVELRVWETKTNLVNTYPVSVTAP